jgi:hypothetical protein
MIDVLRECTSCIKADVCAVKIALTDGFLLPAGDVLEITCTAYQPEKRALVMRPPDEIDGQALADIKEAAAKPQGNLEPIGGGRNWKEDEREDEGEDSRVRNMRPVVRGPGPSEGMQRLQERADQRQERNAAQASESAAAERAGRPVGVRQATAREDAGGSGRATEEVRAQKKGEEQCRRGS